MSDELAEQAVDAINDLAGAHPGHRAAHAKGTLLTGTFTPARPGLTTAAHMQDEPTQVTVRFSNGSGVPDRHDGANDGRGLAVKLYLPDGSRTDIVAITLPVFFVRTAKDFLEFTRVRKPLPDTGQPDMEKLGAFLAAHPEAGPAIQHQLSSQPPASYAQLRYFAIHAYRFTNAAGEQRWVRYRWEPEAGEASLDPDEARGHAPDYLRREILSRLEHGPAAFTLHAQIARDGDPVDDPTAAWPEERETVELGRLEVTGLDTERETGDDVLVFDPTRVTDGIECSDDEILQTRPGAYSVSVARRTAAA
jgi:catalase